MDSPVPSQTGPSPRAERPALDEGMADAPEVTAALEPDTLPNRPLRASDVPGFIPKLIG